MDTPYSTTFVARSLDHFIWVIILDTVFSVDSEGCPSWSNSWTNNMVNENDSFCFLISNIRDKIPVLGASIRPSIKNKPVTVAMAPAMETSNHNDVNTPIMADNMPIMILIPIILRNDAVNK